MKIFDYNATPRLLEKANGLEKNHTSWRCVYLNLASSPGRYNRTLRTHFVIGAIRALLADEDVYVYLCDDGDIFILFEGALKPIAELLGSHFEDFNSALQSERSEDSLFTIFDLSYHYDWQSFCQTCKRKYSTLSNGFIGNAGFAGA